MSDLEGAIKEDSKFFDAVTEMIPARFYFPTEIPEDYFPAKFGKNKKGNAPKQAIKEATKKARKAKFDPENEETTVSGQQKKRKADALKEREEFLLEEAREGRNVPAVKAGGRGPKDDAEPGVEGRGENTITALRERLRRRIDLLRTQRNTDKKTGDATDEPSNPKKRRRKQKGSDGDQDMADETTTARAANATYGTVEEDGDVSFGAISFGVEGLKKRITKKMRAKLLEKAEKQQERLKALEGTEEGAKMKSKKSWGEALAKAHGKKLMSDPKLLRQTIKRDESKKRKSEKQWADRKKVEDDASKLKQQTREERLEQRKLGGVAGTRVGKRDTTLKQQQQLKDKQAEKQQQQQQQEGASGDGKKKKRGGGGSGGGEKNRPGFEGRYNKFVNAKVTPKSKMDFSLPKGVKPVQALSRKKGRK